MPRKRRPSENIFDEVGTRHPRTGRVRFCAVLQFLLISGLYFGIPVLLVITLWFDVRSLHLLWYPFAMLLLALLRAWLGSHTHCCICNQPMFLHRPIAKSRHAPSYSPLGIHSTAAVLSLLAKSIRCPYCGRVNRLTKD